MIKIIKEIKQMKGNAKGIAFITFFRLSSLFISNNFLKFVGFPIRFLYKLIVQWILGIDVPDSTIIGFGFNVYHGQSLIINEATVIGKNVTVRHSTTIGNARAGGGCPVIGNNVDIGANSVIIGEITIGDNSIIGAGSVVVKNVPENVKVAGNPARVISQLSNE
jgi:serine acetyltransferase